jgi:hypothetical protein
MKLLKECLEQRKKFCRYFEMVLADSQVLVPIAKELPTGNPEIARIGRFFDSLFDTHDVCLNDYKYAKNNTNFGEKLREKVDWIIQEGEQMKESERKRQQSILESEGFEGLAQDIYERAYEDEIGDGTIKDAIRRLDNNEFED